MEPSTPAKLPGLTSLTKDELSKQYQAELGHEAGEDLHTRQDLIDAIQAHRDQGEVEQAEAAESAGPPKPMAKIAYVNLAGENEIKEVPVLGAEFISTLLKEELQALLDDVLAEATKRGLVGIDDAPESSTPANHISLNVEGLDEEQVKQVFDITSGLIAGMVGGGPTLETLAAGAPPAKPAEPEPLTAGPGELIAVRGDEQRVFNRDLFAVAQSVGWQEQKNVTPKPEDL